MEETISTTNKKSNKKKIVFIIFLILFTTILLLTSIEIYSIFIIKKLGYIWEPAYLRMIKGYKSSNMWGARTEDHSWGQWGVPNFQGNVVNMCMDYTIKFNSWGARDKERSLSGKNRTLVIGDSFTEGWGVDQDKTLPADLEKLTGKEFLNFGSAGGMDVLNAYVFYKDFAYKFEHDAVISEFTVGNDFEDNDLAAWEGNAKLFYRPFWKLSPDKKDFEVVYYAPFVKGKFVPGLEPKNKVTAKLYDSWTDFSAALNLVRFINGHNIYFKRENALTAKYYYNLDYSDDATTATVLMYDKFAKLIGDKEKYVLMFPSATDIYHYLAQKKIPPKMETFKKTLSGQGWKVIDAIYAFSDIPEKEVSKYWLCDGHPSAQGYKLIANYVHKFIK